MATAFQTDAFQAETLWPTVEQVLVGVTYGPNGNDYTGMMSIDRLLPEDITAIAMATAESVWSYTRE